MIRDARLPDLESETLSGTQEGWVFFLLIMTLEMLPGCFYSEVAPSLPTVLLFPMQVSVIICLEPWTLRVTVSPVQSQTL